MDFVTILPTYFVPYVYVYVYVYVFLILHHSLGLKQMLAPQRSDIVVLPGKV